MRVFTRTAAISERHPNWPHTRQGDLPDFDLRKLGKNQRDVLQRIVTAYQRLNRGLTARDLGAESAADRAGLYSVFNSLARRGLVLRDPPGVRGVIPALGADRISEIETREAAKEPPAPVRVLFGKKIAPDTATGTVFPTTVENATGFPFQPGENSAKLGSEVRKGRWAGFPIYSLTMEERATCPKSCHHWTSCMGNNMPQARRYRHGGQLDDRIRAGLWDLDRRHPAGYVIRLHQLGDFFSTGYVALWREALDRHPLLNVFGYTAHDPMSDIGCAIRYTRMAFRDRFAIRHSGARIAFSARTILHKPLLCNQADGIVCPEQMDLVDSCGDCTLCWTSKRPILFIDHAFLGAA